MKWVRLWVSGGRGHTTTQDRWQCFADDDVPNEETLKAEAEDFAESTQARHYYDGYKFGFDDPVSRLPDEARNKLIKEFEERKQRAEVMLKILRKDAAQEES